MNKTIFCLLISSFLWSGDARSFDLEADRERADHARYICSSELKRGADYETKILASGDVEFKIIGKKGGVAEGTYIYKYREWEEQQKVLAKDQAKRDSEYTSCVTGQLEIFRGKKK